MKKREKATPPQGSTRIPEAIDRLVQRYEATGKKEYTVNWRKEREAAKAMRKNIAKKPPR